MKIFNGKKFIRMEVIRLAQRGRKPKPTAVKQLEGNPGKRQLNANEPKPAARAPSCPKWLEDDAKKEWRRLAKQMEQLGILTEVDMAALRDIAKLMHVGKRQKNLYQDTVLLSKLRADTGSKCRRYLLLSSI